MYMALNLSAIRRQQWEEMFTFDLGLFPTGKVGVTLVPLFPGGEFL